MPGHDLLDLPMSLLDLDTHSVTSGHSMDLQCHGVVCSDFCVSGWAVIDCLGTKLSGLAFLDCRVFAACLSIGPLGVRSTFFLNALGDLH